MGCTGDGGASTNDDLEVVGDGQQFGGRFADLPLLPRSDPISELTERSGTVTRSYQAEGASIDRVMSFYEDRLPALGWEVLLEPQRSGTSTIQAEWRDGDLVLRITANDAAGLGGDTNPTESVRSQYSLIMSEA